MTKLARRQKRHKLNETAQSQNKMQLEQLEKSRVDRAATRESKSKTTSSERMRKLRCASRKSRPIVSRAAQSVNIDKDSEQSTQSLAESENKTNNTN